MTQTTDAPDGGKRWRVCWRNIATGETRETNKDKDTFPEDVAKQWAGELNRKWAGVFFHWIEEATDDEQQQ